MKKVNRILAAIGAGALALAAGVNRAPAAQITITSVVPQSGYVGLSGSSNPLTGTPYDFTGQGYATLTSLDSLTVTLSVADGHTDVGEIDHGNWTLGLDGIDTGLKLNGFAAGNVVTLTLTNLSNPGALLAALQADGLLVGSILDATTGDGNFIAIPSAIDTALDITGTVRNGQGGGGNPIPLPAAALLAPLGAALAGGVARRFRKQK